MSISNASSKVLNCLVTEPYSLFKKNPFTLQGNSGSRFIHYDCRRQIGALLKNINTRLFVLDDIFTLCVDKFRIPLRMTHHLLVPPTIHHVFLLIYHCREVVLFYFPSKSFNKRIVSLRFIARPAAHPR